jgi:penicillin V acylase-like amidase (Ntn superfamily)
MFSDLFSSLPKTLLFLVPLLGMAAIPPVPVLLTPCTTFCLEGSDGPVFGRNYDWNIGMANVTINRRGLAKRAMVLAPDTPAEWTSKYGSITFNQYGHEFPTGGMNEAGLVVEVMWLTGTSFPEPDKRAAVRELQWVQYQLDNCRTIDEVLATDAKLRVTHDSIAIHFLVCDASGEQASLELLGGQLVVHRGADLPVAALANSTYESSLKYLESIEGFGGERPTPKSSSSLDRFVRASCGVVEYEPSSAEETMKYAFGILEDVRQGDFTKWSIVYDIEQRLIHFRTTAAPMIKTLSFADFRFEPEARTRILDIDTPLAGNPAELFVDYTTAANRKLVLYAWKHTDFLADAPEARLKSAYTYPESVLPAKPLQPLKGN